MTKNSMSLTFEARSMIMRRNNTSPNPRTEPARSKGFPGGKGPAQVEIAVMAYVSFAGSDTYMLLRKTRSPYPTR